MRYYMNCLRCGAPIYYDLSDDERFVECAACGARRWASFFGRGPLGEPADCSELLSRLLTPAHDLAAFLNDLATAQAVAVGGTEAAVFLVEPGTKRADTLRPVVHIRPDNSDEQAKATAVAAFKSLVWPCVESGKNGAIEVGRTDGERPQYCLVANLWDGGALFGTSAVIAQAAGLEEAKRLLAVMRELSMYSETYRRRGPGA